MATIHDQINVVEWKSRALKAEAECEMRRIVCDRAEAEERARLKAEEALREIVAIWRDNSVSAASVMGQIYNIARSALTPSPALCDTWPDNVSEFPDDAPLSGTEQKG